MGTGKSGLFKNTYGAKSLEIYKKEGVTYNEVFKFSEIDKNYPLRRGEPSNEDFLLGKESLEAVYSDKDIQELSQIGNFTEGALNHIFKGEINRKGKLVGYHYEKLQGETAEVISGTRTHPNKFGVYEGRVRKRQNGTTIEKKAASTFFPEHWSPQRVVNEVNEAYRNKANVPGLQSNVYEHTNTSGVKIRMFLDENGKIKSAFPIK